MIRPLTEDDVPRLVALEHELFYPSPWSEAMLREELQAPGRWYVGIDGDLASGTPVGVTAPVRGLVAYAGLWFDGDVAQVMTIGVARSAWRRGFGRTLLTALVYRATALDAQAVLLEVRVDNAPAIALYESHCFEVLTRRRRYYQPDDVDAFTMRLLLRDDT